MAKNSNPADGEDLEEVWPTRDDIPLEPATIEMTANEAKSFRVNNVEIEIKGFLSDVVNLRQLYSEVGLTHASGTIVERCFQLRRVYEPLYGKHGYSDGSGLGIGGALRDFLTVLRDPHNDDAAGLLAHAEVVLEQAKTREVESSQKPKVAPDGLPIIEKDDEKDYVLVSKARTAHTPHGVVLDNRKFSSFLKHAETAGLRIRVGRPRQADGSARKNRKLVHLADWTNAHPALLEWHQAQYDERQPTLGEVEARTEAIKKRRSI